MKHLLTNTNEVIELRLETPAEFMEYWSSRQDELHDWRDGFWGENCPAAQFLKTKLVGFQLVNASYISAKTSQIPILCSDVLRILSASIPL